MKIRLKYPEKNLKSIKEEIWAEIFNNKNDKIFKKLIWWRDDKGVYHDESPKLPIKFRGIVDSAWISHFR